MNQVPRALLIVLSFVLTLILWVYVQVQEHPYSPPPKIYDVPVTLEHQPDALVVVSYPATIRVRPNGPLDERERIQLDTLKALIDLKNASAGTFSYSVTLKYPTDLAVKFDYAPQARVKLERRVTKLIAIRVQTSGQLPNQDYLYLPESTYTEPPSVSITGPESDVERVELGGSADVLLDLNQVDRPGRAYRLDVYLLEDQDRSAAGTVSFEPKSVVVRPAMAVGLSTRTLHVIPKFKGLPPIGFSLKSVQVTPENVAVRGESARINGLQYVVLKEIDLNAVKESKSFPADLQLPPGVVVPPSQTPITVSVEIETSKGLVAVPPNDVKARRPKRRLRG